MSFGDPGSHAQTPLLTLPVIREMIFGKYSSDRRDVFGERGQDIVLPEVDCGLSLRTTWLRIGQEPSLDSLYEFQLDHRGLLFDKGRQVRVRAGRVGCSRDPSIPLTDKTDQERMSAL